MKRTRDNYRSRVAHFVRKRPELLLSPLVFILFVGSWELIVDEFRISPIILPAPSRIVVALFRDISGSLPHHFLITFYETGAGFVLGAAIGLLLGGLIAQSPLLERTLYPYVVAFQTVPKVAMAPLMVIWFGYGLSSKIVITATIAFFPVLANTIAGLRATPADQLELMEAIRAGRWRTLWKVRLPNALPYILVGLDVAVVLSVIGAIVGEFVGAREGLGYLIMQRNFSMDVAGVFGILIVLALMGVTLHLAMRLLQRKLLFWTDTHQDNVTGS